jgi:hypothetical protein
MITLRLPEIALGVILLGTLQFLTSLLISERLKASLQKENAVFLENLRWDLKVREQAAKVANYLAIARDLNETDSQEEYRSINRLSWELAMWLPEDIYRAMGHAIAKPNKDINPLAVVVDVRKILLGATSGNLTQDDIIHHAPGIGKKAAAKDVLHTDGPSAHR